VQVAQKSIRIVENLLHLKNKKFEKISILLLTFVLFYGIIYTEIKERRNSKKRRKVFIIMRKEYTYNELKNETGIKATATADLIADLTEMLVNKFGEENVRKVGNKVIGFVASTVIDKDGCPHDLIFTVDPTIKDWDEKKRNGRTKPIFDLFEAAEAYEIEVKTKAKEREEKRVKKQQQIEKDKVRRAAEREAKKAQKE